jgi:two-component system, NarL family, nitrate/nitrite response regulator NarL
MRILLVDDHTLFREALLHVLNQLDSKMVVLEASNIEEASRLITHTPNLDLILLDIALPRKDGLTALPSLRELAPTVPIVVLSGSESSEHVKKAMQEGAFGYIPKTCSSHEMLAALHIILQGDVYIPPKLLGKLDSTSQPPEFDSDNSDITSTLTHRQLEVLDLLAKGLPNKSIARQLNLGEGTVKLHVASIFRALGTRNRTQAVAEATRLGLVNITKSKP